MEENNIDDIKQLLNFYRQKSSNLELQALQLQLKLNRLINVEESTNPMEHL